MELSRISKSSSSRSASFQSLCGSRRGLAVALGLGAGLLMVLPTGASEPAWPGYLHRQATVPDAWPDGPPQLRKVWETAVGPSYSSPVVGEGKVFLTFSRQDSDVLAAFDLADGEEAWSVVLGPRYRGHDGSEDGPLSTPWVGHDRVVAVSAAGNMVAVSPSDGRELWRHELVAADSELPFYGFASSPRGLDDAVLIQAPGTSAGRLLRGADGEETMRFGAGGVTYQSPVLWGTGDARQILITTNRHLEGWSADGTTRLWSFQHKEKGTHESAHPIAVDGQRLLLVLDQESVMLRIVASGEGEENASAPNFVVEELWRAGVFKRSDARPVVQGEALFGFNGNVFAAVSAADGALLWRSRELSGNNLSAVGDYLVQLNKKGELVLATAAPEAAEIVTRLKVLEAGDYGNPAVAGDLILVRNQTTLAAVRVESASAAEPAAQEPAATGNSAPATTADTSSVE